MIARLIRSLLLFPRKLYLLVRYDVKQQLTSPWFYLILVGLASLPPSWYFCYPENASFKVLMVDGLKNANFETVATAIKGEGFQVEFRDSIDDAMRELLEFDATMVVHVRPDGDVAWYAATPRIKKTLTRAIQSTMLEEQNKVFDRLARAEGGRRLRVQLVKTNYFEGQNKRHVSTATFVVRTTWYFAGLISLTMFILAKPSMSKMLRMYSMPMILTGKLLAGFICGSAVVFVFLVMMWLFGIQIPNMAVYLFAFACSIASGVAFGCMCGGIPLALTNDLMGLVFAALMGLSLTFMGYGQLSAFLTPISNMDPMIYIIDQGNPLYNLNQFIYNCVFLGDDPWSGPNPEYIAKVWALTFGCIAAALVFLLRL